MILDPIQAYLGGGMDMNRANEARDMTKKLGALAEKYQCAIKVMQCHITFEKMSHQSETLSHHFDIFGYFWHPKGVFGGFQGECPSDQKHFVIQNAYLAKPEFSVLRWLMASGGEVGE